MFCTNCGNKLEDGALFCTNCGQKIEAEEPKVEEPKVEEPKVEEPKAEEPKAEEPKAEEPKAEEPKVEEPKAEETPVAEKVSQPENVKPQRTIHEELKRFVRSPLVIIAILCFTAFLVFSIIEAGSIVSDTFNEITDALSGALGEELSLYYDKDVYSAFESYFEETLGFAVDAVNDFFRMIMIVLMLPDIVVCACLWITLISAFDKKALSPTTAGLTTVKVMNIISLVFISIFSLLILADVVLGIIGLISNDFAFATATLFAAVILLPIFIFALYYKIKIVGTINSFTLTAKRNFVVNKASKFVAVMLMISGVLQALLGLLSTSTVSTWLGAIATVSFSIIIFKYRSLCEYMMIQNRK